MNTYIKLLLYYSFAFIYNVNYAKSFIHNNTSQAVTVSFVYKNPDPKGVYKCTRESMQTSEIPFGEKRSYEETTGTCMLIRITISGKENSAKVIISEPPLKPSVIEVEKPSVENPGTFTWSITTQ